MRLSYLAQTTSKIRELARSGFIICARKLFDEMPHRDLVAWNAMLSSYGQLGLHEEVLSLFHQMRVAYFKPDHFSFTATLSSCAGQCRPRYGQKVHALVLVSGCFSLPVGNSLIDMYGKCLIPVSANDVFDDLELRNAVSWCSLLFAYVHAEEFDNAQKVFVAMPERVGVAWNTMIAGHARRGEVQTCIDLFKKMSVESCGDEDQWTFSALMNACTESLEYMVGRMVHGVIVKRGWCSAVEANNSILSFYAKVSSPTDVIKMFQSIRSPTLVSWNAIVDAQMKMGNTREALLAFQQVPDKNVISWTSMITGYARNGMAEEAIGFFVDMIRSGLQPDNLTLGAVLHACSILATLGHGKMVHGFTIHYSFHQDTYVGNGLVNMYAKCGDIQGSNQAFSDIIDKDLVSWNTMLLAYGLHGWGNHAFRIHEEMMEFGVKPDHVTFVALLMTCSHLGLIDRGWKVFESMSSVHGLYPDTDHVACMVDMLGRGGYSKEARDLADRYMMKTCRATARSGGTLFGACLAHGDVEMGLEMRSLDPRDEMSYVLLSNLYCASGKWKEAEAVRKAMADSGVRKMPGCSWIEVKNSVMAFVAGRHSYLGMEDLSSMLRVLEYKSKNLYENL